MTTLWDSRSKHSSIRSGQLALLRHALCSAEVAVEGRRWAVFNPHNKPVGELPTIYGFNNGGSSGWMSACLIAEDGAGLGSHICSHEGYMEHDLGIIEGSRPDRHETFRGHYPDGYRMEFISSDVVRSRSHAGLEAAYALNQANAKVEPISETK